jgi:hypothetical protein
MFRRGPDSVPEKEAPAEARAPMPARLNGFAWEFAKVAIFALVAEQWTLMAAAWLCAAFYGASFLLGRNEPGGGGANKFAPLWAIFWLVIGGVGLAIALGWHVTFWQAPPPR